MLEGVTVLDLGTMITGPLAAMLLADMGADVIKVEPPDGDPFRSFSKDGYSPQFVAYNRGKRSVGAGPAHGGWAGRAASAARHARTC